MTTYENMAAIASERTCDRETDAHMADGFENPFEQNYLELMALFEAANYLQAAMQENVSGLVSMTAWDKKSEIHILPEAFDRLFANHPDLRYEDWPSQDKCCVSVMIDGTKVFTLKAAKFVRMFL